MSLPILQATGALNTLSIAPAYLGSMVRSVGGTPTRWEWIVVSTQSALGDTRGTNGDFVNGRAAVANPRWYCVRPGGYVFRIQAFNAEGESAPITVELGALTGTEIVDPGVTDSVVATAQSALNAELVAHLETLDPAVNPATLGAGNIVAGDQGGGGFVKAAHISPDDTLGVFRFNSGDQTHAYDWVRDLQGKPATPQMAGARADGTTDDGDAWFALRNAVRARGGPDLLVPQGTHRVDALQWAKGLTDGKISGYGSSIYRGGSVDNFYNQTAFWHNSNPFYTDGWAYKDLGPQPAFYGHLIDTTSGGASGIVCTTHADAGNYHAGDWILIYGYSGGATSFPPWSRHFEYARVVSANATTGAVELDRYLADEYRSDWYDYTGSYPTGKARILNMTRTDFKWADKLVVEGIDFAKNPNITNAVYNGGCYFMGGDKILVQDCRIPYCVPTVAGDITFVRCKIGLVELDKLVRSVTFVDCDIGVGEYQDLATWSGLTCGVINGVAIKRVNFINTRIYGTTHAVSAQDIYYKGCTIGSTTPRFRGGGLAGYVTLINGYSNWPSNVVIEDCEIAIPSTADGITDSGDLAGFKVAASPAPTATTCALSHTWDLTAAGWRALTTQADFAYLLTVLCRGTRVYTAGGKTCRVDSVTQDAINSVLVVTGEFSATPVSAEEWRWSTTRMEFRGRNRYIGANSQVAGKRLVGNNSPVIVNGDGNTFRWTEDDMLRYAGGTGGYAAFNPATRGKLLRLTVDVKKAYTGASPDCNLYIDEDADSGRRRIIDMLHAGVRVCDFSGTYGTVGADSLAVTTGAEMKTLSMLIMSPSGPWAYPLHASNSDLSIYTVKAEFSEDR